MKLSYFRMLGTPLLEQYKTVCHGNVNGMPEQRLPPTAKKSRWHNMFTLPKWVLPTMHRICHIWTNLKFTLCSDLSNGELVLSAYFISFYFTTQKVTHTEPILTTHCSLPSSGLTCPPHPWSCCNCNNSRATNHPLSPLLLLLEATPNKGNTVGGMQGRQNGDNLKVQLLYIISLCVNYYIPR